MTIVEIDRDRTGAIASDTYDGDNLRTAYEQLFISYRAIDDFRAKLLGFLPLVTGGGLALPTGQGRNMREEFFRLAGLFGIAATAGLLAYELFGIKKCHALLLAGEDLEKNMGLPVGEQVRLPAGQFVRRPPHLLRIVNEPFTAAAIYPAVLAAWTYLLLFDHPMVARLSALTLFTVGFVGVLLYDQSLKQPPQAGWTSPSGPVHADRPDRFSTELWRIGRTSDQRPGSGPEPAPLVTALREHPLP